MGKMLGIRQGHSDPEGGLGSAGVTARYDKPPNFFDIEPRRRHCSKIHRLLL